MASRLRGDHGPLQWGSERGRFTFGDELGGMMGRQGINEETKQKHTGVVGRDCGRFRSSRVGEKTQRASVRTQIATETAWAGFSRDAAFRLPRPSQLGQL